MKCPRCGSPGFYPANLCSVCDFPLDDKRMAQKFECPRCDGTDFYNITYTFKDGRSYGPSPVCTTCEWPSKRDKRNSSDPSKLICPLCGEVVVQVSSATLDLALWQHIRTVCSEAKRHAEQIAEKNREIAELEQSPYAKLALSLRAQVAESREATLRAELEKQEVHERNAWRTVEELRTELATARQAIETLKQEQAHEPYWQDRSVYFRQPQNTCNHVFADDRVIFGFPTGSEHVCVKCGFKLESK